MKLSIALFGLASLIPPATTGCTLECSTVGCLSGATLCGSIAPWQRIRICRNTGCTEIIYGEELTYVANGVGVSLTTNQDSCVTVVGDDAYLLDGDRYTLTTWDETDTEIASYRWTAQYTRRYIDDEACGNRCANATLDATNAEP